MPLQDIMNAPQSFGPSITERQDALDMGMAKGYADVTGSLAETEMKNMEIGQQKKKQSLLENFQGKTNTPEFYNAMDTVDPELVTKMTERAAKMDKNEREKLKEYMDRVVAKAQMAENEQQWVEQGFTVPYSEKNKILGAGLTYQEIFDRQQAKIKATTGENSKGGLKVADEKYFTTKIASRYEGSKFDPTTREFISNNDPQFRNEIAEISELATKIYNRNPNMEGGRNEAANQAYKQFQIEKEKKNRRPGGPPPGFQSGAGPSSSGKDYRSLM